MINLTKNIKLLGSALRVYSASLSEEDLATSISTEFIDRSLFESIIAFVSQANVSLIDTSFTAVGKNDDEVIIPLGDALQINLHNSGSDLAYTLGFVGENLPKWIQIQMNFTVTGEEPSGVFGLHIFGINPVHSDLTGNEIPLTANFIDLTPELS